MTRLRHGELLAGLATAGFVACLLLAWFEQGGEPVSGASTLGWPLVVLLVVPVALIALLVVSTVTARPVAWAVTSAILATASTILLWPLLVLRTLVFQPDDNAATTVTLVGWLGLLAFTLMAVGSWLSMGDERTGARESAYEPPPARPLPGPRGA
jgi:hypothetical protein